MSSSVFHSRWARCVPSRLAILLAGLLLAGQPSLPRAAADAPAAPASADPAQSAAKLISEQETLGARDATTREYTRVYELPTPDGQSEPQRVERKIIEKADSLNFDAALDKDDPAAPANWQPTVNTFIADPQGGWTVRTGPAKVHVDADLYAKPFVKYEVPFRAWKNGAPSAQRVRLALSAGRLVVTDKAGQPLGIDIPHQVSGHADGNKIVFPGAFACGDLELVYQNGELHQNVIIRNPSSLPIPAGVDAGQTQITVQTDVADQSDASAVQHVVKNQVGRDHLVFYDANLDAASTSSQPMVAFTDSKAWSAAQTAEKKVMEKKVVAQSTTANTFTQTESITLADLQAAPADQPYVLDYIIQYNAGILARNEAWQTGNTYYVSGTLTVPSDKKLAIEGGAVVKVSQNASITVQGTILAQGTTRNYIIFTSASDNSVGQSITGGTTAANLIYINSSVAATGQSIIAYCKFGNNSNSAIRLEPNAYNLTISNPIQHCIFRGGACGIKANQTGYSYYTVSFDVFNCLFALQTSRAIDAAYSPFVAYTVHVYNCTVDGTGGAGTIGINGAGSYALLFFKNNLVSNYATGIYARGSASGQVSTNRSFACTTPWNVSGPNFPTLPNPLANDTINALYSPYDTANNRNGNYYINDTQGKIIENGEQLMTANIADKTIHAPTQLTGSSSVFTLNRLSDSFIDTNSNDIGFHHDVVDAIFYSSTSYSAGFTATVASADPRGLVVTGCTAMSSLNFTGGSAKLQGTPTKPIVFTYVNATSDQLTDPYLSTFINWRPAVQTSGICSSLDADFVRFEYGYMGLQTTNNAPTNVTNCIFYENYNGLNIDSTQGGYLSARNCLFTDNTSAGIYVRHNTASNINVELDLIGNTFSRNDGPALYLYGGGSTMSNPWRLVLEDNIFADHPSQSVTSANFASNMIQDITRNNIFYNNASDSYSGSPSKLNSTLTLMVGSNNTSNISPLFVHRAPSNQNVLAYQPESGVAGDYRQDGYYLAQQGGDASRLPFDLKANRLVTGLSLPTTTRSTGNGLKIFVVAADMVNDAGAFANPTASGNYRAYATVYTNPDPSYNPSYTIAPSDNQTKGGPLAFYVYNANATAASLASVTLTLTLADGTQLAVALPAVTSLPANSGNLALWVADDGSSYYVNSPAMATTPTWTSNAWYALRFAGSAPACTAYTGGATSPAVDKGSKDYLSAGWTRTDLTKDNPVPVPGSWPAFPNIPATAWFYLPDNAENYIVQSEDPNDTSTIWSDHYTLGAWDATDKFLDIGYHYGGQSFRTNTYLSNEINPTVNITLRHPKYRIGAQDVTLPSMRQQNTQVTVNLTVPGPFALASADYNATTQQDTTVLAYAAWNHLDDLDLPTNEYRSLLLAKLFRSGDDTPMIIKDYSDYSHCTDAGFEPTTMTMITSVAATSILSSGGSPTLYVAAATVDPYLVTLTDHEKTKIDVFRYAPSSNPQWVEIASLEQSSDCPPDFGIDNVALTARGDDLYVFWRLTDFASYDPVLPSKSIFGHRIANARTKDPDPPDTHFSGIWLTEDKQIYDSELAVDWDEDVTNPTGGCPRIVFLADSGYNEETKIYGDGKVEVHAARVGFNNGEVSGFSNDMPVDEDYEDTVNQNNSYVVSTPNFALMRYDATRFSRGTSLNKGCVVYDRHHYNVSASDHNLVQKYLHNDGGATDDWSTAGAVLATIGDLPALTTRAFGLDRIGYPFGNFNESTGGYFDRTLPQADGFQYDRSALCAQPADRDNIFLGTHLSHIDLGIDERHIDFYQVAP